MQAAISLASSSGPSGRDGGPPKGPTCTKRSLSAGATTKSSPGTQAEVCLTPLMPEKQKTAAEEHTVADGGMPPTSVAQNTAATAAAASITSQPNKKRFAGRATATVPQAGASPIATCSRHAPTDSDHQGASLVTETPQVADVMHSEDTKEARVLHKRQKRELTDEHELEEAAGTAVAFVVNHKVKEDRQHDPNCEPPPDGDLLAVAGMLLAQLLTVFQAPGEMRAQVLVQLRAMHGDDSFLTVTFPMMVVMSTKGKMRTCKKLLLSGLQLDGEGLGKVSKHMELPTVEDFQPKQVSRGMLVHSVMQVCEGESCGWFGSMAD